MRALHLSSTPALALALLCAVSLLPSCTTRTVNETVSSKYGLEIKLRSQKKLFGETTPRGFDHPSIVAPSRLELILGGIEIDVRRSESSPIRERRKAIPPKLLWKMSNDLSDAFTNANSDQEIVVLSLRKEMQHGIFNRKFLTSFTTYMKDGRLYVYLSRIDWPIDERHKNQKLPDPIPDENVMIFAAVPNELYVEAGRQAVSVDWQSPRFDVAATQPPPPRQIQQPRDVPNRAPEAAVGGAAAPPSASSAAEQGAAPATGDPLRSLTADDYRALADLEEERSAGRISEAEYESAREALLRGVR